VLVVNHTSEPTMNAKPTALDAYLARTAAIHAKLERLQQLADDHFGHDPDAIHWGHVGDLGRVETGLDELLCCCALKIDPFLRVMRAEK
jgi:hypothetical protein